MRKKKILFIGGTLQSGGVSKSLVTLLNVIDRDKYDIHLLILSFTGDVFGQYLPKNITIHRNQDIEELHNGVAGVKNLLKRCHFLLALGSVLRMLLSYISKAYAGLLLSKIMPKITGEEFDLIVDYGGQQQLYYMVDKLKGRKKVSFFHSDYKKWPYYYSVDKNYYPKVEKIFTISEECVQSLKDVFPDCSGKIVLMENISSPQIIDEMSKDIIDYEKEDKLIFISLGHISSGKGSDMALGAAKILKGKGLIFKWIFLGKILESKYIDYVRDNNLSDCIDFVGIRPNPYPYIKMADLFIHTSRFEGKSIALDEAKILCKPIVVTNFSTVNDQFENGVNATICNMDSESIANSIIDLVNNKQLQSKYIQNLKSQISDNSSEIEKLYKLMD